VNPPSKPALDCTCPIFLRQRPYSDIRIYPRKRRTKRGTRSAHASLLGSLVTLPQPSPPPPPFWPAGRVCTRPGTLPPCLTTTQASWGTCRVRAPAAAAPSAAPAPPQRSPRLPSRAPLPSRAQLPSRAPPPSREPLRRPAPPRSRVRPRSRAQRPSPGAPPPRRRVPHRPGSGPRRRRPSPSGAPIRWVTRSAWRARSPTSGSRRPAVCSSGFHAAESRQSPFEPRSRHPSAFPGWRPRLG
jgi:hypothetical protein